MKTIYAYEYPDGNIDFSANRHDKTSLCVLIGTIEVKEPEKKWVKRIWNIPSGEHCFVPQVAKNAILTYEVLADE